DNPIDARLGPAVTLRQSLGSDASTESSVDFPFHVVRQRLGRIWEDGRFRVMLIVILKRIPDGLDRPSQPPRQAPTDLRRAPASPSQSPGARNDLAALGIGELGELGAALDVVGMTRDEPLDRRLQETDPLAIAEHEATTDQSAIAPPIHGLRRNLEPLT